MARLLALFLIPILALFLTDCSSKRGPVVAKVKGLKIRQADLDTVYPDIRDKERRTERLRDYLKGLIDDQVMYNEALKMGFQRMPENKSILKNIEMIETANFYYMDVIQKNWGFLENDVVKQYNRDRELYKKEKPAFDEKTANPAQKKALDEWKKDPYKPLDVVRSKVLRTLLMARPENRKALNEFIEALKKDPASGGKVDSGKIIQKEDEIISQHTTDLDKKIFDQLKIDHKVEILAYVPKISEDELRAEWEKTKQNYKRQPDLQVAHIEVADQKTADKLVDEINNKNKDFDKLQKKSSLRKETVGKPLTIRANEDVQGFPGDTRSIYPRIAYVPEGKVSTPIALRDGPNKESFHIFKMVKREPEALQSFEEAKQSIRQSMYTIKQMQIPETTTVAKVDGKPLRAADIFTLLYKMSPMVVERYKTEEGRKQLLETYYLRFVLFTKKAREQGLLDSKELQARINKSKRSFIVADFRQNYLDVYYGLPESEVRKYYKENPDTFKTADKKTVRPFEEVRNDVISRVLITPKMVEDYYTFNMEDYADNDGAPKALQDVRQSLYYTLLAKVKASRTENALRQWRRDFGLKVYQKELDFNLRESADAVFERTKKLHEDRKYSEAMKNYQDLRFQYPDFKAHPDICMAMAQIYIEQNQYNKAIQEYKRFMRLYPDSKDKYKAQFMIGFVYSENLKDKEKSIGAYQSVLDNYPKCDLVESAKFMIDHLKSGKEDFFIADDSTAVADSAAAKPAEPAKKK